MTNKLTIAFVCTGNTFRSQIGEAFAKKYGSHLWTAYSAGLEVKSNQLHPFTPDIMSEISISMTDHHPKLLADIPATVDILVTMGCGAKCPYVPTKHRVEWSLPPLDTTDRASFVVIRDAIQEKVKALVKALESNEIVVK